MDLPTCYMCEAAATTREHVPPKCLFPEAKDADGQQLRDRLITVPSCDLHNGAKSRDDEFLMVCLAGMLGNNSIGYRHSRRKVHRAIKRSAGRLLDAVWKDRQEVTVPLDDNKFLQAIVGSPDIERLTRCFDQIVRALHHYEYGAVLRGIVQPHLAFLVAREKDTRTFSRYLRDLAALELKDRPMLGANPSVFFYQTTQPDQFGNYLYRLCFYGRTDVYVAIQPEDGAKPSLLAVELILGGIPTVLTIGDQRYCFNGANEND